MNHQFSKLLLIVFLVMFLVPISMASRLDQLKNMGVTYGEGDANITVWISPTCHFCKSFHHQMLPKLIEQGFSITYLVMMKSKASAEVVMAETFYCAKAGDKKTVVESFYNIVSSYNIEVPQSEECKELAYEMTGLALSDVRGTPTIVFPDDSKIVGNPKDVTEVITRYLLSIGGPLANN